MQRREIAVVALAALWLAGVGGCTSEPRVPDGPRPTSDASATVAPSATDDAVAAYEGMWRAFGEASRSANWKSPDLARYSSGHALDQLVESLQADEVQGVVTTGTFTTNPTVASATPAAVPTVVRIGDCGDGSGTTRVRASDGQVLAGGNSGRHRIDAEIRLDGGLWKVVDFRLRAAGSC